MAGGALRVGDLFVVVTANVSDFSKSMKGIADDVARTAKKVEAAGRKIGELGKIASVALGAAMAIAAEHNERVSQSVERMKAVSSQLAVELSSVMVPVVDKMAKSLEGIVGWFQRLSPEQKQSVAHWAGIALEIVATIAVISKVAGVVGGIADGFGALWGVISTVFGLLSTLAATVITPAMVVVAALVGAAVLIYEAWTHNWGGIQEKVASVWTALKSGFSTVLDFIGRGVRFLVEPIAKALNAIIEMSRKLAGSLGIKMDGAFDFAHDLVNWTDHLFSKDGLKDLYDTAKEVGTTVAGKVVDGVNSVKGRFNDFMKQFQGKAKIAPKEKQYDVGEGTDLSEDTVKLQMQLQNIGPLSAMGKALWDKTNEELRKFAQAVGEAQQAIKDKLIGSLGTAGQLVGSFEQGTMAAGGNPMGGVANVAAELLMKSKQFQQIIGMLETVFQSLSDWLGKLLTPIEPLIGALTDLLGGVFQALGPVIDAVASVMSDALQPLLPIFELLGAVFKILRPIFETIAAVGKALIQPLSTLFDVLMRGLFPVLKIVGEVLGYTLIGLGKIWNAMISVLNGVIAVLSLGFDTGALDGLKVDTDAISASLNDLNKMTYDSAKAKAQDTTATLKNAAAMQQAAGVINGPNGFKVSLARWVAMKADADLHGADSSGGPGVPTNDGGDSSGGGTYHSTSNPGSGGTYKPGHDPVVDKFHRGDGVGDSPVTIHIHGVTDPDAVASRVIDVLKRRGTARTGSVFPTSPRFA